MRGEAENYGTCIVERKEQRSNLSSSVGQPLRSRSGSVGNAGTAARSCSADGTSESGEYRSSGCVPDPDKFEN
jgi:hypothetical protein